MVVLHRIICCNPSLPFYQMFYSHLLFYQILPSHLLYLGHFHQSSRMHLNHHFLQRQLIHWVWAAKYFFSNFSLLRCPLRAILNLETNLATSIRQYFVISVQVYQTLQLIYARSNSGLFFKDFYFHFWLTLMIEKCCLQNRKRHLFVGCCSHPFCDYFAKKNWITYGQSDDVLSAYVGW